MSITHPPGFHSAKRTAESLTGNKSKISLLLADAVFKAGKNKRSLKSIWNDLTTLFRLIRAWVSGAYRDIPWQIIVLAIAAVIYFVNPFDLVPDLFPFIGYVDDATVVGFVVASIANEIAKFHAWEQSHS